MELFCLGPTGPDGTPELHPGPTSPGLAKAFTGWALNTTPARYGRRDHAEPPTTGRSRSRPSRFELTAKAFLGIDDPRGRRRPTLQRGPATINTAVDTVLAHRNHAQFLIRKLWAEFIASPIPQATLDSLVTTYRATATSSSR